MASLTYIGLKALATGVRLTQSIPAAPKPDEIVTIPSRDHDRAIKVHIYKPTLPTTPSPVLLNFHGSGFVIPAHGSDDIFCRLIAQKTKDTVLDIQYRLAPEHPFPAAPHDVEDAIKYVLAHPEEYDQSQLSLSGFSAGGNLALAVLSSTTLPQNIVHSVLAFYPPVDLSIEPSKKVQPDPSGKNVIPAPVASIFNACYVGKHDKKDPMVSPAFMDVARVPKNLLLITCAYDTLAFETETFAKRVETEKGEGTHLVWKRIEGVGHAWDKSCKAGSEGERRRDEAYNTAVDILNGK